MLGERLRNSAEKQAVLAVLERELKATVRPVRGSRGLADRLDGAGRQDRERPALFASRLS